MILNNVQVIFARNNNVSNWNMMRKFSFQRRSSTLLMLTMSFFLPDRLNGIQIKY
jgi:hypothetical protein